MPDYALRHLHERNGEPTCFDHGRSDNVAIMRWAAGRTTNATAGHRQAGNRVGTGIDVLILPGIALGT
jgi:hypothetical protein